MLDLPAPLLICLRATHRQESHPEPCPAQVDAQHCRLCAFHAFRMIVGYLFVNRSDDVSCNSAYHIFQPLSNAELCGEETEDATSDLLGNACITLNNYSLNKFKSCC